MKLPGIHRSTSSDHKQAEEISELASGPLNLSQRRYFLVIFLLSILALSRVVWPFWQLLILAFLLAGIFRPIYLFLRRWVSAWLASSLTCGLIILIVFVPLTFCIGALSSETLELLTMGRDSNLLLRLQSFIRENILAPEAQAKLAEYGVNLKPEDVTAMLSDLTRSAGLFIYNQASTWAANIMSFILQFLIMILVVYFLLIDLERLVDFLVKLSPLPDDQDRLLMRKFQDIAGVILIGNGISGVFQGVLGGSFFAIFGLNSPVLWGSIMAVLAFLPIFGIGLVLIPTGLIYLLNGSVVMTVVTLVFYAVLSGVTEYLLKPKFVGSQVKMHTLLVFLSIIGGMAVFGVLGIIYGPLIVTAFLTLADIYLQRYQNSGDGFVTLRK
jgi:predicted PurR-regulated permease PerM